MDYPTLMYPHLCAEEAAARFDLLAGIVEDRIVPEAGQDDDGVFFYYVYDPEQLDDGDHKHAIARFDREIFDLEDEGLVTVDPDSRVPVATDAGRAWFDQMQAYLEAITAIDQDRVYLMASPTGDGYLHTYDQREGDEFDASGGIDLTPLRTAGLIDWGGDMIPFITKAGGEVFDAYRPELFQAA